MSPFKRPGPGSRRALARNDRSAALPLNARGQAGAHLPSRSSRGALAPHPLGRARPAIATLATAEV